MLLSCMKMFQVFIAVSRVPIHSATTTVLQQAHKSCETTINLIVVTVKVKVWALHLRSYYEIACCKLQDYSYKAETPFTCGRSNITVCKTLFFF